MNFERAAAVKDASVVGPSQESLRAVWAALDPEQTANPQVAGLLAATALGLDRLVTKAPPAPVGRPPLVTEPQSGVPPTRPMSDLEQRVATERGITPKQWQDHLKGHVPGRPSTLEDD